MTTPTHIRITYSPQWSKGPWQVINPYSNPAKQDDNSIHEQNGEAVAWNINKANAALCAVAPEMAEELWKLLRQELRGWCWYVTENKDDNSVTLKIGPHNMTELLRSVWRFVLLTRANALKIEEVVL